MKARRATAVLMACAGAGLGVIVAPARASTAVIGAVDEVAAGTRPSTITGGGDTVQVGQAAGSYAVESGPGTITTWSHSTGSTSGTLTFKVYRPTGNAREFRVVAADTRTVAAGTVHTFAVQIPVQAGDRIGLSSEDVELAYETGLSEDRVGFFRSSLAVGETDATVGNPQPEFKLDVAATVESTPAPQPAASPYQPLTPALPTVSGLRIAPRAFATRGRRAGATATYRAGMPASVRFTVRRLRRGRPVPLRGGFTRRAIAGVNRFRFTGRLRRQRLRPGSYELVATPRAGGVTGRPATARFRVIRSPGDRGP